MKNIAEVFFMKLVYRELGTTTQYGCRIYVPSSILGEATASPWKKVEIATNVKLCKSLTELYEQVETIDITWLPSEDPSPENPCIAKFKSDPWLKQEYFDNNYSWDIVKEFLSGTIQVPRVEKLLGRSANKKDGYYLIAKDIGVDPDTLCPFDFHNRVTAVLKIEENSVIDNVYLIDLDARELHDMKISINQYLQLAYEAKLFNCWQLIYLKKNKSEYYELMKRFLPLMLPHLKLNLEAFGIK